MEKMFKCKMVNKNKCMKCAEEESYKHLLWECKEVQKIWELCNTKIYLK
jgi:type IV secretory pathway VirB4 component